MRHRSNWFWGTSLAGWAASAGMILISVPAAGSCPPGPNLTDTDADGLMDHACVGDWNDNGSCEMQADLAAAILLLDDPGAKTIELHACSFAPVLSP